MSILSVCLYVCYTGTLVTTFIHVLAVSTRPLDGVLLAPAAPRLVTGAVITVVRTEFRNRSLGVASAVVRT